MSRRAKGEGSIHPLPDGRYRVQIDLGWRNGKRWRPTRIADTKREAGAKLKELRNQGEAGLLPLPGEKLTVERWMEHWLHHIAKGEVRETTWVRSYRPIVTHHIIPHLGKIRLDRLNEDQIEALYAHMRAKGMAGSTILGTHRILSRALKVATQRRWLGRNPCQFVTPPSYERPEIQPLDSDEAHRFLAHVNDRWNGARWSVALALGLRQGEALGLLWSMVDLDDLDSASIRVAYELIRLPWRHGCDGSCGRRPASCPQRQGGGLMLDAPKSQKSRRVVTLPRPLAERLKRHRLKQREERLAQGPLWTGWTHNCDRKVRAKEKVCPRCRRPTQDEELAPSPLGGRLIPVVIGATGETSWPS